VTDRLDVAAVRRDTPRLEAVIHLNNAGAAQHARRANDAFGDERQLCGCYRGNQVGSNAVGLRRGSPE
jgi:hypothetical protein